MAQLPTYLSKPSKGKVKRIQRVYTLRDSGEFVGTTTNTVPVKKQISRKWATAKRAILPAAAILSPLVVGATAAIITGNSLPPLSAENVNSSGKPIDCDSRTANPFVAGRRVANFYQSGMSNFMQGDQTCHISQEKRSVTKNYYPVRNISFRGYAPTKVLAK
jgi:hypothetical protein